MERIVSRTSTAEWDENYHNAMRDDADVENSTLDKLREKDYIIGTVDDFVSGKIERLARLNASMDRIRQAKTRNNRRFKEVGQDG